MSPSARLGTEIAKLSQMRYPVMVVIVADRRVFSPESARQFAESVGLCYVDYLHDVLDAPGAPTLGAYDRVEFLSWLKAKAKESGGVVVDHSDPIITTWPAKEREAFFREFIRTESRGPTGQNAPIMLVSALAGSLDLPTEPRGQGLVIRLAGGAGSSSTGALTCDDKGA